MTVAITAKCGQLGNRLFLFAHFIGFARATGTRVLNPAFDEYAPYFEGTQGWLLSGYPRGMISGQSRHLRHFVYRVGVALRALLKRVRPGRRSVVLVDLPWDQQVDLDAPDFRTLAAEARLLLANGWLFRSEHLLHLHAPAIRAFFQPVPVIRAEVDGRIVEARRGADVLIGLHVRRGDYRTFNGGAFFFPIEEYRDVMGRVVADAPGQRIRFLVCSDEARSATEFAPFDVVFGAGEPVTDMYLLAACDLIIGPPSTFSMWASFFGDVSSATMTGAGSPSQSELRDRMPVVSRQYGGSKCT